MIHCMSVLGRRKIKYGRDSFCILILFNWNVSDPVKLYTGLYAQELEEQMSQIEELQKEEQLLLPENIDYLRCLSPKIILIFHMQFPYTRHLHCTCIKLVYRPGLYFCYNGNCIHKFQAFVLLFYCPCIEFNTKLIDFDLRHWPWWRILGHW